KQSQETLAPALGRGVYWAPRSEASPRREGEGLSRVIAIANQKGGVGKTTTAINLGAGFAVAERRTLIVDMDPQGNATSGLGIERSATQGSIYDVLVDEVPIADVRKVGGH